LISCRKLLGRLQPAVIHTHGGTAGFTGRVASLGFPGRKTVHTYHGLHYLHARGNPRNAMFRLVDKALLRATDRIICVAQSDLDLGLKYGVLEKGKTSVIRNGIDLQEFQKSARDETTARSPVVGTIGRLHVQKGHGVLLQAVAQLRKMGKDFVVRIIGDGELRKQLEAKAMKLGVDDVVEFHGASTNVAADLAQMDLFVLPSLWEGLPIVLLEAMAAGVPVVASGVDGIPEIVTDGLDGVLVPVGQPTALAEAMARMLKDPLLCASMVFNAREKVQREFSVERMTELTEDLYEAVLREGS
jgi:glycosyltransferase involved in cell wall biosynthesis